MSRLHLADLTFEELRQELNTLGESGYRAGQIFAWVYQKGVHDFQAMTNVSKGSRAMLAEHFRSTPIAITQCLHSVDGSIKFTQVLEDGRQIESVIMNHEHYSTVCISTQVGCAMGCTFCLTGKMGLKRNLRPFEIVDQVRNANAILAEQGKKPVRNIVYMGMGEPLHNYKNSIQALKIFRSEQGFCFGSRRITISTSGLIPQIEQFAQESVGAYLAVSLNGVTQDMRASLMPIARRYPLERLIATCTAFAKQAGRKVTYEYILIAGITDSLESAAQLADLLRGSKSKVNLIPFNESDSFEYKRPNQEHIHAFQKILLRQGILATQRHSKAQDILGACGQLILEQPRRAG